MMGAPDSLAEDARRGDGLPARVSVAMCTYNGATFLAEQLKSVAEQTLLPYELVVCDDRSTDDTIAMLEACARTAAFAVRIEVNAERLGAGQNFGKALRLCSGELIALCDQDDRWEPNKLERLVEMLQADPEAGGVFTDAHLLDGESKVMEGSLWERFRFREAGQERFRRDPVGLLLKHDIVTGATMMVRRSVLQMFETIGASWLHDGWLTWMIVLSGRMLITPERLTYYRLHASQEVGAGGVVFRERVAAIKLNARREHTKMVERAEQMVSYIETHRPENGAIAEAWRRKAAFMAKRAALASGPLAKVWFMARHLGDYQRYARGLRSMRKDLVL